MYISFVEINNYRGFERFEVSLSKLAVILGENGSGKSNFFSALALPLGGNQIHFNQKRLNVSDINVKAILRLYQAIIDKKDEDEIAKLIPKVSVELTFTLPQDDYEEAILKNWLTADPSGTEYKIKYEFLPRTDSDLIDAVKKLLDGAVKIDDVRWFTFPVEFYEYRIISSNNLKQIPFNDLKNVVMNYINADRDDFSENGSMQSNGLLTRMLETTLDDGEKASINKAYTEFFKAIEDTDTFKNIIDLSPGFENYSDYVDSIKCIPNLPNMKNILSNITLKTGDEFLYQKGLGERNLLYIILLFEFYKNRQQHFNLCCIEEPEAHLGVNNLRLSVDFIYKSTEQGSSLIQTLVSTHNPAVLNKLKLSNVVVFSGNKAITIRDNDDELTDYLRKRPNFDILKLIFADRVILVEGQTEEMLLNSFYSKDASKLNNVEIISAGQKGFKTFMDIWLQVNEENNNKKIGISRDFDDQPNAKNEHDQYDKDNANICVRTTEKYTMEDDLVGTGNNTEILKDIFELDDEMESDAVSAHMKDSKADAMLTLCDALLDESTDTMLELPKHLKEIVDFMA